jgi:hypothetical protein
MGGSGLLDCCSANDPVVSVLQLAARLAPLLPPNPEDTRSGRDVSAVRRIGNALTATAPEIELYATNIRFFSGPPLSRVRESISNY